MTVAPKANLRGVFGSTPYPIFATDIFTLTAVFFYYIQILPDWLSISHVWPYLTPDAARVETSKISL